MFSYNRRPGSEQEKNCGSIREIKVVNMMQFNSLTMTDRSQEWNQMDVCLGVHCKNVPSHSLRNNQQDQGLFWTQSKEMKVGEMNTVTWKLINPQGKVFIISPDWNTLLRIFVNGNRSIKILEMWNELKKKLIGINRCAL